MSQQEVNWDLDSDEIASIASEELHEKRPNRWKGSKSTWRHITEEERLIWRMMKELQDEDLGVHLYNAFALKKRAANPETVKEFVMRTENGQEAIWTPPKSWTAWPLRQKHLPPVGLFKDEGDDGEDEFTFRRKEKMTPSSELRSEVAATILRIAKERFSRRKPPHSIKPSIETPASPRLGDDNDEPSSTEAESESRPSETQAIYVSLTKDEPHPQSEKKAGKTYDPVVSADDDLSATLLKPSVQHILSQVDKTLTILHNTRVAGLSYLSDSSETETEEESDASHASTTRKRGRGRPRLAPQPSAAASSSGSKSRRGRPKRTDVPAPGETQEQMALRVARRGHRRLPATEADREVAFEDWLRQGDERVAREQRQLSSRPVSEEPESHDGSDQTGGEDDDDDDEARTNAEKKIRRWGLRDWSDVVGAAALAGFPPHVVARTAQRCANLFGQGMALTRLDEVPAARAAAGVRTTTYQPEHIRLSPSDSDSDSNSDSDNGRERAASLKQRRIASRQASLARSSREPSSADTPRRGRPAAAAVVVAALPQSEPDGGSSRSSAGLVFCPLTWCERAADGFSRRANLRRHMRLVHPGCDEGPAAAAPPSEDSEDEMVGAVHVDGFLRTVNPGKGWRGEGTGGGRKRRGTSRSETSAAAGRPTKKLDMAPSDESE